MPSLTDLKYGVPITETKLASGAINGNIATGAVTVNKLAGSLDLSSKTLTLPSGVFGAAQLPAGTIIGAWANGNITTEYDIADQVGAGSYTSYRDLPGFTLTFTTKKTNSKFWLLANTSWYQSDYSGGINIRFTWNGSAIQQSNDEWQGLWHSSSSNANSGPVNNSVVYSPNVAAGTSVTVKVQGGMWSGGTASDVRVNYAGYGIRNGMAVFEIA